VMLSQMSENVKRTDLATGIDRPEFACLDPEYLHRQVDGSCKALV
jgi:hypothetical protein